MHIAGLLVQLKNTVYKELFSLLEQGTDTAGVPAYVLKEPVTFIRLAQEKWERKLKQAVNKLCIDYKVVLAKQVCAVLEVFWQFLELGHNLQKKGKKMWPLSRYSHSQIVCRYHNYSLVFIIILGIHISVIQVV